MSANWMPSCSCINLIYLSQTCASFCPSPSISIRICARCSRVSTAITLSFCCLFILPFFLFTEDQQVIEDEGSLVLQTRPSVSHSMRAQPAPTTYVTSPQIYPPYQMLQNEFVANELRVRNVGALEPTTPLIPSPSDSFGVSSPRYFIYCIYILLYVLYILYLHYFIPYSICFHSYLPLG